MNLIHTNTSAGLLRTAMVLICVLCLTVLTVGCDDEGSSASKLEEAKIAIDDGNYSKAITILDGMTGQEVLEVLASAHAGLSGIDTFEILSEVDDGGSNDGSIDLIGKMLGTGDSDTLFAADITIKLGQIDLAKTTLMDSVGGNIATLDDDGKAKLAIYALTDVVLNLGQVISTQNGGSDVVLTEDAINALAVTFDPADFSASLVTNLEDDLDYIALGITALGGQTNDLSEEFTAFRDEVTKNDGTLISQDLADYLNGL